MKKSNKILLVSFFLIFIVSGFLYGYKVGNRPRIQDPSKNISKLENGENNNKETEGNQGIKLISEEKIVRPSTLIEFKIHYSECDHTIIETKEANNEMVNMKEDQFKSFIMNNNPNWEVVSFGDNKIVIEIEKKHLCPNHFLIGVKAGKVAIYKIDENGKKVLYQIINQPVELLKKVDQERLEQGIVVDDEDELGDVLENFIS